MNLELMFKIADAIGCLVCLYMNYKPNGIITNQLSEERMRK